MAPPNLSAILPIAETLVPAPKQHKTVNEHGPHSVVSTYSKSHSGIDHSSQITHPSSTESSKLNNGTTPLPNSTQIIETTEIVAITDNAEHTDLNSKLTTDKLITEEVPKESNVDQTYKVKMFEVQNIPANSEEDESMEDEFSPQIEDRTTKPEEGDPDEPAQLDTQPLLGQSKQLISIQPSDIRFVDSQSQAQSSFSSRSKDTRIGEPNQGFSFHPYDYSRMGELHPEMRPYDLPQPIISNGFIYYPTFPRHQMPLAREISNHPVHKIPSSGQLEPKFGPSESPSMKDLVSTDLPPVTTYRSRSANRPTYKTKSDRGHIPTPRPQNRKYSSTTTVKSSSVASPADNPFLYKDNFNLLHFEEELADFSNLYHHQKSLEELARNGKDVAVREDDWLLTGEGATAIILVGMCSIIMMIICFIFVLKKFKEDKGEEVKPKKHHEDSEEKAQSVWLDLYNPVNLIPQISYLHTLPHVEIPSKEEEISKPSTSAMSNKLAVPKLNLPISPFVNMEEFTETHLGRIWFTVRNDLEKSSLHVNIRHARYPKGREISGNTGELWVEGKVLSAMNTIIASSKTSTRRATPSPVFNHSFLFMLDEKDATQCLLKLIMHDQHPKKGEEIVGSIILPLSSIDLSSNELLCRDLL